MSILVNFGTILEPLEIIYLWFYLNQVVFHSNSFWWDFLSIFVQFRPLFSVLFKIFQIWGSISSYCSKFSGFLVSFGPFLTDLGAILVPLGLLNQSWCHINQFRWAFCSIWPFFLLSFYHNVPNCHFIGCHPSNFWWFYPIWADSMPFFFWHFWHFPSHFFTFSVLDFDCVFVFNLISANFSHFLKWF